jgi:putative NADH-flavin reductase
MKIAIVGITGMTGAPLADELLSREHQVTGIARNPARAAPRPGLTLKAADIMDMNPLAAATERQQFLHKHWSAARVLPASG